jgi:hypothetical protein
MQTSGAAGTGASLPPSDSSLSHMREALGLWKATSVNSAALARCMPSLMPSRSALAPSAASGVGVEPASATCMSPRGAG